MCSLKTFVRFYWLLWTMRLVLNAPQSSIPRMSGGRSFQSLMVLLYRIRSFFHLILFSYFIDFVSFRYIFFSYFTEFVVSFRWISFSYFTDFVEFRFLTYRFRFISLDFVFLLYRFRCILFSFLSLPVPLYITMHRSFTSTSYQRCINYTDLLL